MPGPERTGVGPPADPVTIDRISLKDFRNYPVLVQRFEPGFVVLTGDNGSGKTNLLEAISLLSPGRGLRRATYPDMVRSGGTGGFAVHARVTSPMGEAEIGTAAGDVAGDEAGGSRRVRINQAPARSADDMLEWLRVIWLTPAMDGLFTGPAADRRRFLDRLVLTIDAGHGRRALDYEKSMRSRNRLLADNVRDAAWFEAVEAGMAETGAAIAAARVQMVSLLTAMVEKTPAEGAFPRAGLVLSGALEERIGAEPSVEVEERYRRALADNRERDRAAGRTLEGPHRSDLLVRHVPKDMPAELCSTGEQKALLAGIVLSHARLAGGMAGMVPILLLDEIAAHFDHRRRAALFDILADLGGQVFMTGTEAELFSAIAGRAQFLSVAGGMMS